MATAAPVKKKTKLFDKRVNFEALGDKTLVQFFGKVCTIGQVSKKLWVFYKDPKYKALLD